MNKERDRQTKRGRGTERERFKGKKVCDLLCIKKFSTRKIDRQRDREIER
jgi:hypothetical protein